MYHLLSSKNCFITNGFSLEIGGGGGGGGGGRGGGHAFLKGGAVVPSLALSWV